MIMSKDHPEVLDAMFTACSEGQCTVDGAAAIGEVSESRAYRMSDARFCLVQVARNGQPDCYVYDLWHS